LSAGRSVNNKGILDPREMARRRMELRRRKHDLFPREAIAIEPIWNLVELQEIVEDFPQPVPNPVPLATITESWDTGNFGYVHWWGSNSNVDVTLVPDPEAGGGRLNVLRASPSGSSSRAEWWFTQLNQHNMRGWNSGHVSFWHRLNSASAVRRDFYFRVTEPVDVNTKNYYTFRVNFGTGGVDFVKRVGSTTTKLGHFDRGDYNTYLDPDWPTTYNPANVWFPVSFTWFEVNQPPHGNILLFNAKMHGLDLLDTDRAFNQAGGPWRFNKWFIDYEPELQSPDNYMVFRTLSVAGTGSVHGYYDQMTFQRFPDIIEGARI
jgi:hypothetical protein